MFAVNNVNARLHWYLRNWNGLNFLFSHKAFFRFHDQLKTTATIPECIRAAPFGKWRKLTFMGALFEKKCACNGALIFWRAQILRTWTSVPISINLGFSASPFTYDFGALFRGQIFKNMNRSVIIIIKYIALIGLWGGYLPIGYASARPAVFFSYCSRGVTLSKIPVAPARLAQKS